MLDTVEGGSVVEFTASEAVVGGVPSLVVTSEVEELVGNVVLAVELSATALAEVVSTETVVGGASVVEAKGVVVVLFAASLLILLTLPPARAIAMMAMINPSPTSAMAQFRRPQQGPVAGVSLVELQTASSSYSGAHSWLMAGRGGDLAFASSDRPMSIV